MPASNDPRQQSLPQILDMMELLPFKGGWSVFYTGEDERGWYQKWCGQKFDTYAQAEAHQTPWAKHLQANGPEIPTPA